MPTKRKTSKFRGSARHGRGHKAGRGKGLKGGKGNSGLHKHRYATTVIAQKNGYTHFGRHGFVRHADQITSHEVLNVRDLETRFAGESSVDLGEHGVTKLLGGGRVASKFRVKVETASASAVAKIEAAGGKVETEAPVEADVASDADEAAEGDA